MNIFNFCGSGSGGSGGTSVLIQYQKTVDSSHNTQMIVADYPYQAISQVEVLAPNMENPVIDASSNTIVVYTSPEDSSGNAYIGMDSVTINAPIMETRIIDSSYGALIVDRDTANYVGLERVIVNAPLMKSITINPSQDSSTVYNIVDEGDVAAGYVGIEQVTVPVVTAAIDNNILPENIKSGVTIIGVTGVYNQEFDYAILYNRLINI